MNRGSDITYTWNYITSSIWVHLPHFQSKFYARKQCFFAIPPLGECFSGGLKPPSSILFMSFKNPLPFFIIFLIQNWMILQGTFAPRSHSAGSGRAAFTLLPLWSPMSLPAAESARVVETGGNCGAVGGHRSCRCGWWCEGILAVESVESWKWGKLMDEVATVWGRFAAAGSVGLGPRHLPWRWEWPRIWPSGTPESYLASPGADAFRKLKRRTLDSNRGCTCMSMPLPRRTKWKGCQKSTELSFDFPDLWWKRTVCESLCRNPMALLALLFRAAVFAWGARRLRRGVICWDDPLTVTSQLGNHPGWNFLFLVNFLARRWLLDDTTCQVIMNWWIRIIWRWLKAS